MCAQSFSTTTGKEKTQSCIGSSSHCTIWKTSGIEANYHRFSTLRARSLSCRHCPKYLRRLMQGSIPSTIRSMIIPSLTKLIKRHQKKGSSPSIPKRRANSPWIWRKPCLSLVTKIKIMAVTRYRVILLRKRLRNRFRYHYRNWNTWTAYRITKTPRKPTPRTT